jgi:hypothetical protein
MMRTGRKVFDLDYWINRFTAGACGKTAIRNTRKECALVHLLYWNSTSHPLFPTLPNSVIVLTTQQLALQYHLTMAQRSDDCLSHAEVRSK